MGGAKSNAPPFFNDLLKLFYEPEKKMFSIIHAALGHDKLCKHATTTV